MNAPGPKGRYTSDYEFDLPPERIAQFPAETREASRLLVVDRATGAIQHRRFPDIVGLIAPGDLVVVNETRVFPARLRGTRGGGGSAEALLLRPLDDSARLWTALVRPGGKLKPGRRIHVAPDLTLAVEDVSPGGERILRLESDLEPMAAIERYGEIPLPPYVRRAPTDFDRERYQTVYATASGSVAAPTAGLHFTPELIAEVERKGAAFARLVLHVGVGTFRPVEVEDPAEHRMHVEWYRVPEETAHRINQTRRAGGAIWAVGTTTVRTLETVALDTGEVRAGEGWTDIFIRPPYSFRAVDRLVTNFHLPRSTLLMLVAAFAGYDLMMDAYREAVERGYRFYSYGDAMVVL